jgi:hypothetical protein
MWALWRRRPWRRAGANILIGGSGRTFALRPLSVEGSIARQHRARRVDARERARYMDRGKAAPQPDSPLAVFRLRDSRTMFATSETTSWSSVASAWSERRRRHNPDCAGRSVLPCEKVPATLADLWLDFRKEPSQSAGVMPLRQEGSMDRFIRSENIQRYRKLLERATDESQRQQLLKLLSEEAMKSPRVESPQER